VVKNLDIQNFKSIKQLKLDCKRINVFIGRPNTGKSNILESLGLFSILHQHGVSLKDFVRFENMTNLFYDQDLGEKIFVGADGSNYGLHFFNGVFHMKGVYLASGGGEGAAQFQFRFGFDYDGGLKTGERTGQDPTTLAKLTYKFYKFAVLKEFSSQDANFLLPPRGENLLSLLLTNKALKKTVADLFSEFGLRLVFEPQAGIIKVQKEIEDVIISYPYSLVSDTLQRVVFHLAAIETNKRSIIIFEEPESHAFPYYTKFLAERIALDASNQYFIATHNPYFLMSVLEKAPKEDIGVFITYFEDFQTKVKPLSEGDVQEVMDLDESIFFNLDRFLDKG